MNYNSKHKKVFSASMGEKYLRVVIFFIGSMIHGGEIPKNDHS